MISCLKLQFKTSPRNTEHFATYRLTVLKKDLLQTFDTPYH